MKYILVTFFFIISILVVSNFLQNKIIEWFYSIPKMSSLKLVKESAPWYVKFDLLTNGFSEKNAIALYAIRPKYSCDILEMQYLLQFKNDTLIGFKIMK